MAAEQKKKASGKGKKLGSALAVNVAGEGQTKISPGYIPRLQKKYNDEIAPKMKTQFKDYNPMQIPRLKKITINCAVKEAVANPKVLDNAMTDLMLITGQKPVLCRARKAIAQFKVREGNPVAVRVTLRRARMYEFLDRLINVALPRVRDFKGISNKAYDGRGNYSLGLREQIIFPEISYDKVDSIRGMTVSIETTARTNDEARALLAEFGMPFRK